mmetsp:Transcript_79318/g.230331  ORF Transcript_79318/g.230331 Transcript_79318/m.230331 type:complete len:300 (-) Transcript_79318:460-1359(-)
MRGARPPRQRRRQQGAIGRARRPRRKQPSFGDVGARRGCRRRWLERWRSRACSRALRGAARSCMLSTPRCLAATGRLRLRRPAFMQDQPLEVVVPIGKCHCQEPEQPRPMDLRLEPKVHDQHGPPRPALHLLGPVHEAVLPAKYKCEQTFPGELVHIHHAQQLVQKRDCDREGLIERRRRLLLLGRHREFDHEGFYPDASVEAPRQQEFEDFRLPGLAVLEPLEMLLEGMLEDLGCHEVQRFQCAERSEAGHDIQKQLRHGVPLLGLVAQPAAQDHPDKLSDMKREHSQLQERQHDLGM